MRGFRSSIVNTMSWKLAWNAPQATQLLLSLLGVLGPHYMPMNRSLITETRKKWSALCGCSRVSTFTVQIRFRPQFQDAVRHSSLAPTTNQIAYCTSVHGHFSRCAACLDRPRWNRGLVRLLSLVLHSTPVNPLWPCSLIFSAWRILFLMSGKSKCN
jgi:hypothetical protein